jgi:hypothetical protein
MTFRRCNTTLWSGPKKAAIAVWRREGFEIVATLPAAFRHPDDGYVNAYVMFRTLAGERAWQPAILRWRAPPLTPALRIGFRRPPAEVDTSVT